MNPPNGWHPIETYTDGKEIVILGKVPECRTGEDNKHKRKWVAI